MYQIVRKFVSIDSNFSFCVVFPSSLWLFVTTVMKTINKPLFLVTLKIFIKQCSEVVSQQGILIKTRVLYTFVMQPNKLKILMIGPSDVSVLV